MDRSMQDIAMSIRRPTDHQLSQNDPATAALLKDHAYQRDTIQTGLVSAPSRELGQAEAGVGDQPGHSGHIPQHQQHQRQLEQQQKQQPVQQSWPQRQAQHEVSKPQPQQQQQQQQGQQTLAGEADHRSLLLSDYVPPAAYTQLDVPVLMQQTAAAIARWGELQKNLDIRSDEAPANLAAQAQVRVSIKRDLTNLTQLADAQTKHTQRIKMRQMQAMATKAPSQGGFRGGVVGGGAGGPVLEARGGVPAGEAYKNFPQKPQQGALPQQQQQQQQQPPGGPAANAALHGGDAAAAANSTPYATGSGPMGTVLANQGSGGGVGSGSGASGLAVPQAQQNNRHEGIRQRIDRTEPVNKWAVLVEASIRLPPGDGATFKQFLFMVQNLLNTYNGDIGAEVARALGTCLDPRVFDPMDIKRAQERMVDIYSRFRRSQR